MLQRRARLLTMIPLVLEIPSFQNSEPSISPPTFIHACRYHIWQLLTPLTSSKERVKIGMVGKSASDYFTDLPIFLPHNINTVRYS